MKPWAILLAIGIGSFLAVLLVCGGMGAGFMYLVYQEAQSQSLYGGGAYAGASVPGINYHLQGPTRVVAGEAFTLEAVVENTGTSVQTLHSLVNYSRLNVLNTTPAFQQRQGNDFSFNLPLQPGQQETIQIEAVATTPGWDSVNFDVHINSSGNYVEAFHSLEVLPAGSPPPVEGEVETVSPPF